MKDDRKNLTVVLNPIRDGGGGWGKEAFPSNFFPSNFYKRSNQPPKLFDF